MPSRNPRVWAGGRARGLGAPRVHPQVPLWAWGLPILPRAPVPLRGWGEGRVYKNTDIHALHWTKKEFIFLVKYFIFKITGHRDSSNSKAASLVSPPLCSSNLTPVPPTPDPSRTAAAQSHHWDAVHLRPPRHAHKFTVTVR